ncbi:MULTISPECIES: CDP-glycerol glycerophosphotransferase family protein [unclassified Prochlorococcus]|uniref:CDP-glycerol glycerophosphotransferase family protein n=1 Tax=unclassified Prochlorococcus TaxID=2627481 RepID=UPI00097CD0DD|nr:MULTISPECIES: CDP-glycerol glycerophosphotransferase family protein [unclassified Prochlorococcus]AQL29788.1 hypothetical protein BSR22_00715 [Prochlorococcus sp. RS50]AQL31581.1 hypothetical protein BS620_00760 [Prochlorococcus sp. RS01]AQL34533.1 hypothetical protein BS621_07080 [Prochlorococcus sp. RS04]
MDKNLKKFEKLENTLILDSEKFFLCFWWEGIRYRVFEEIRNQKNNEIKKDNIKQRRITSFFKKCIRTIRLILLIKEKFPFFSKRKNIFIFSNNRRTRFQNYYIDIYADPFIEILPENYDYSFFEGTFNGYHGLPPKKYNIFYLDYFIIFSKIIGKIIRPFIFLNKNKLIFKLKNELKKSFGKDYSILQKIKIHIVNWHLLYFLYYLLLYFKKPLQIFVVDSQAFQPLVFAAKKLKIPVLELQHGSPFRGKLNYDYSSGVRHSSFPDWFLCFSKFWKNDLEKLLPIKSEKILCFGFPYINSIYVKKLNKKSEFHELKNKKVILILSQPTVANELIDFTIKLRENIDKDIKIIFKPHPFEYKSKENILHKLSLKSIIIPKETTSLSEIFAISNCQLGVYSTAIYEGLNFGLKTYILNIARSEYMSKIIELGYAKLVSDPRDIINDFLMNPKSDSNKPDFFSTIEGNEMISYVLSKINN